MIPIAGIRYLIPLEDLAREELSVMFDQLYSIRAITEPAYYRQIEALIRVRESELAEQQERERWTKPAQSKRTGA